MSERPAGRRAGDPSEPTGSLAEEALRLIETLGLLAGATDGPAGEAAPGPFGGHTHGPGSAPECRICPVCRLIVGIRQLRPEVLAHLVAAGEELLAAARELAASPTPAGSPAGPASAPAGAPDGAPDGASNDAGDGYRPPVRPLQRIDLD